MGEGGERNLGRIPLPHRLNETTDYTDYTDSDPNPCNPCNPWFHSVGEGAVYGQGFSRRLLPCEFGRLPQTARRQVGSHSAVVKDAPAGRGQRGDVVGIGQQRG